MVERSTEDKVGRYVGLPAFGGAFGAMLGGALGATPAGIAALGISGFFGILSSLFSADAAAEQSEAAIKTEEYRKELAEEKAERAFTESLEQASKARKEHIYLSSKMQLTMSSRGISPLTQELWLGQTFAEMEHERQTILGSGQQKASRYHKEASWLQGNIGALLKSKELTNWAHAAKALTGVLGTAGQLNQWNKQKSREQGGIS